MKHLNKHESDEESRRFAFQLQAAILGTNSATERYLVLLGLIARDQPESFQAHAVSLKRFSRVYFSYSRDEIASSGRSTQPQLVPGTTFWALTNMSRGQKAVTLTRLMTELGYAEETRDQARRAIIEAG